MLLEICAYNIQTCMIAEHAGAQRIELCADPYAGGTTPSYGLIKYALHNISIPVFPMIRPKGGNFLYDSHELAIMKQDIMACKDLGCTGIATGAHLPGGRIDVATLTQLVAWAYPMTVTCHKVFDRTPDAAQALEDVIAAGCGRVLTSGLAKTAIEGASVLSSLIAQAAGRIVIMPGGGVRSGNMQELIRLTGATEYHSSGLVSKSGDYVADEEEVRAMARLLNG